jgi:hypothetical protein
MNSISGDLVTGQAIQATGGGDPSVSSTARPPYGKAAAMDLIKASLGDVVKALQHGRISSERLVCVYLGE